MLSTLVSVCINVLEERLTMNDCLYALLGINLEGVVF